MDWEEWVKRNPLKLWMTEFDVTQAQVASWLGVSQWTVYTWLQGARPKVNQKATLKFWKNLKEITSDEEIQIKWFDWEDEKPHPGQRSA